MKKFMILAALLVATFSMRAEVKMAGIFTDNMVLQQQTQAKLWGWADAGKTVKVKVSWDAKAKYSTKVAEDGKWCIEVATPQAGGPYTIEVSETNKITLNDVLIGEVWVCSGQSNMEMPIRGFNNQPIEGAVQAIMEAGNYADRIRAITIGRSFTEEKQNDITGGKWEKSGVETTPNMSALAYFFGKNIANALQVPVGLVITDWGGTDIECWMSRETYTHSMQNVRTQEQIEKRLAYESSNKKHPSRVACLYNAMIAPIAGYAAKGFVWYQGCNNAKHCYTYYDKMQQAMVQQWRSEWGDMDNKMPFLYVLIAPHAYHRDPMGERRPFFVLNQMNAAVITPNSAYAVTETLGAGSCIHPPKKIEIADQLAHHALIGTYGKDTGMKEAPIVKSCILKGRTYEVEYHTSVCPAYADLEEVKGFEVAGADRVFYPAKAKVNYRTVIVEVPAEVAEPQSLRYAFRNVPDCNLTNRYGFPAPPFRTDDWEKVAEK
ncbi:MAG: sialate O-acetylesterase [Bacteroidales bacterium]|jgi:sialate O-acetylesterase|nr:sialate O-acetylesterase [Bacteroidales bacterium]